MNDGCIQELQIVQNKFLRLILKAKNDTPTKEMHEKLKLMTVTQRINFNVIKIFNNITRGKAPAYMEEKIMKKKICNGRALRSCDEIAVPNFKKSINQNSLFYKGVKLYNAFKREFEKTEDKFHIFIIKFITNM